MSVMQISAEAFTNLDSFINRNKHLWDGCGFRFPKLNSCRKSRYSIDFLRYIQLINTRNYNERYSHRDDLDYAKPLPPRMMGKTKELTPIQAYKLFQSIVYNCLDYYDKNAHVKRLMEFNNRLARWIIAQTDEYATAKWGE